MQDCHSVKPAAFYFFAKKSSANPVQGADLKPDSRVCVSGAMIGSP